MTDTPRCIYCNDPMPQVSDTTWECLYCDYAEHSTDPEIDHEGPWGVWSFSCLMCSTRYELVAPHDTQVVNCPRCGAENDLALVAEDGDE